MRKRFLLILSFLIAIMFIAAGGAYLFSWQKEKAKQQAFAVPTPSKDINWIVNENVIEKEALYIADNQNGYHPKPVALRGTEYSFTEVVENAEQARSSSMENKTFAAFNDGWFTEHDWYKNIIVNRRYNIFSSDGTGPSGYISGYFKIWDSKTRVVLFGYNSQQLPGFPPPIWGVGYPMQIKYKIFISNIVPIKSIIPKF